MNGEVLVGLDGSTTVNGVTSDVHDTAEGTGTDGNHDGVAGIENLLTTDETFGTYSLRQCLISISS